MRIYIKKNCHLIKGAKNAAIYDLNKNLVYSINQEGLQLITELTKKNNKKLNREELKYINSLLKLELVDKNAQSPNDTILDRNKVDFKIDFAWLELTDRCNLNCVHCYGEFGCPKENKGEELTIEQWKKIIKQLKNHDCNSVQFIGGEPLIYEGFNQLLEYTYNIGIQNITVFTNATLIDDERVKLFKKYNVKIRISVYGANQKVHDSVTGVKGSFKRNAEALRNLKQNQIDASIAIVIMHENEGELENLEKYIKKIGYDYTGYDVIRKNNYLQENKHSITNYDILKYKYIYKPEFYTSEKSFINNHYKNPCWNNKIDICSNGDVIPCIFSRDEIIGNVVNDTLEEIFEKAKKYWTITKENIDVCKDCEYRYCCYDCRPLAKGINGNIYSHYPRCCYNPYEGKWKDIRENTKEIENKK